MQRVGCNVIYKENLSTCFLFLILMAKIKAKNLKMQCKIFCKLHFEFSPANRCARFRLCRIAYIVHINHFNMVIVKLAEGIPLLKLAKTINFPLQ